jgi:hypothetical protein
MVGLHNRTATAGIVLDANSLPVFRITLSRGPGWAAGLSPRRTTTKTRACE